MKKALFIFLIILRAVDVWAQQPVFQRTRTSQVVQDISLRSAKYFGIPVGSTPGFPASVPDSVKCGALFYKTAPADSGLYVYNCGKLVWEKAGASLAGGTITSSPSVGDTWTDLQSFANLWQKSNPPTGSINGGTTYELTSSSTQTANINYSYGKQAGTQNITAVTINGTSIGTVNANGGSGTISETFSTNTTSSYTLVITTADGKTATYTTTFNYSPIRYYGYSAGPVPTNAEILAAAGGGSSLTSSKSGTFTVTPSGSKYPFVAYVSTSGDLSSISIGGAPYSWNKNVISVTNANSYTQNYNVYVDPVPTSGSLTFTTN